MTTTKDIFHPSHRLESCGREAGTSSGTSKGSKQPGSQVGPTVGLTQSLDHLLSLSDPDLCPSPCQSLTITVWLNYLLKKMGSDLTSTSLMAYLKYSFDIEDGFPNSRSIKQYGSPYSLPDLEQHESSYNLLTHPGEKPLQAPLFRKAISTKIIYFLWIQSEYNLSCVLSKHWEILKILQVLQKLLITNDLISVISWSAT